MKQSPTTTIMVVGEDASFCYLIQRYIKESAYRVLSTCLNESALALAQQEQPIAIILEVGRPDTSGWELLRMFKMHPATCDIPIVLCSWMDEAERGINEGAAVYLRKPVLFDDFQAALIDVGKQ
ncbi:MAG: response regulator [Anaerolineae bacterium]|nr:response regulator [Anaerolineae bacterium]